MVQVALEVAGGCTKLHCILLESGRGCRAGWWRLADVEVVRDWRLPEVALEVASSCWRMFFSTVWGRT